jgi:hypothetical protein
VGVTLEIQTPALLPELVERLAANGCVARPVGKRRCHVSHPEAVDSTEELAELRFFLKAWQASRGGVALTLKPDASPDEVDPDAVSSG